MVLLAIPSAEFDAQRFKVFEAGQYLRLVGGVEFKDDGHGGPAGNAFLNAPKYGNDDNYVDQYALDITEWTEKECRKYKMALLTLSHGTLSISNNTPIGELTNATPNGRLAWMPLSDGISPTQGADKQGPTAIIKSVSAMNGKLRTSAWCTTSNSSKGLYRSPGLINNAAAYRLDSRQWPDAVQLCR